MIGIVIAEKEEISNLLEELDLHFIELNKIKFYIFKYNNKDFVLTFCGVGKVNAAITTTTLINNFDVTCIFNMGFCGSSQPNVKVFDLIIASGVQYHDVDLTSFGYNQNCLPNQEEAIFKIKQKWIDYLTKLIVGQNKHVGIIATGDCVITEDNYDKHECLLDKNILGFDMELMAICQACNKHKIDLFSLKIVSDNLILSSARKSYQENKKQLSEIVDFYIKEIMKNIEC